MTPDRRGLVRDIALAIGTAWMSMVALILVLANEVAMPLDFVLRPATVVLLPAIVIGLVSGPFGSLGRLAAILAAPILIIPELWPLAAGLAVVEAAIWLIQRRRPAIRLRVGQFALFTMLVLFGLSLVRLLPLATDYVGSAPGAADAPGPPVYLLLLDGYPREDELAKLGIDISPFIDDLEDRGFDHYPHATSVHQWTQRTLQAMVAGSAAGIPDEGWSNTDERALRPALQLPSGFVAIDPPASHVVMRGGRTLTAGGVNDFEVGLLGTSIVGKVARDWTATFVADSLRRHFEESLRLMVASDSARTFAHVLAPHPPFLYSGGVADCWPGCNIFDVEASKLGMSVGEWSDRMDGQLEGVNSRVLAAVDAILERDSEAVIVLFSDHGGRYDVDVPEVRHTFLAARTPGKPELFEEEPHSHALLRLTLEAYP